MKRNSSNLQNAEKSAKKRHTGFTLVELVIVIAVLAILSGAGALGYTGYIDYAHRSSDEELIAAVNQAFASACEERGVERMAMKRDTARLEPEESGEGTVIRGILSVTGLTDDDLTAFQKAFDSYFKGNTNTRLEYYKFDDIKFAGGKDMFTGDKKKYEAAKTAQSRDDVNNSNFADDIDGLVRNVENVTKLFNLVMGDEGTLEERLSALSGLGIDPNAAVEALRRYGLDDSATGTAISNAMVLYVAELTGETDTTKMVDSFLANGEFDSSDNFLVALPMGIGLCTAYYNSDYASPEFKQQYESAMSSPLGVISLASSLVSDSGYENYVNSGEARTDVDGYLGALALVDQNKDAVDLTRSDAFSNDEFMELIRSILGGG